MDELVSVIVPVYNAEKTIHRCINSIIFQTYKNIELILIDDGSTDDSGFICDAFRVRVIHTTNHGASAARNVGIELAKGKFITFVDADDYLEPDAVQTLVDNWLLDGVDLVMGDFSISNKVNDKWLMKSCTWMGKQNIKNYLKRYMNRPTGYSLFVYCWANLYKSSIIKEHNIRFKEDMTIFEDSVFNMDYLNHAHTAFYVQHRIYNYTINGGQSAEYGIFDNPLMFKVSAESIGKYLNMDIGQACVSMAIRQMIRYFSLGDNMDKVEQAIIEIVNDEDIQRWLKTYKQTDCDSKTIPYLMKLKMIKPLMRACERRAK